MQAESLAAFCVSQWQADATTIHIGTVGTDQVCFCFHFGLSMLKQVLETY